MGVLRDPPYWAAIVNRLIVLQPALGEPITDAAGNEIRRISCDALSTLLADQQFLPDLAAATDLARSANSILATETPAFLAFVDSFMLLESKILADAGVNSIASRDLDRELRGIARTADPTRLDRLADKIAFLRKLACEPDGAADPKKPLWLAVWRGVKGVAVLGIDLGTIGGTAVLLGPGGAAVAGGVIGTSITYGGGLVSDALKGRW
jgi:hypothetical protein